MLGVAHLVRNGACRITKISKILIVGQYDSANFHSMIYKQSDSNDAVSFCALQTTEFGLRRSNFCARMHPRDKAHVHNWRKFSSMNLPALKERRFQDSSDSWHQDEGRDWASDRSVRISLEEWRKRLPSVKEVSKTLQNSGSCLRGSEQMRRRTPGDEEEVGKANAPGEQAELHWRDCVRMAREEFLKSRHSENLNIQDYLKLNCLTDTFGRKHSYLRISLTEKCNLRCQYCMPEEGVDLTSKEDLLTRDELSRIVRLFAVAGITKVRLTGGEPTLRKDLPEIVQSINEIDGVDDVGITTNGIVLERQLHELKRAGLSLINISLDTLKPEGFEQMTRRKGLDRVLRAIDTALDLGFDPVKVNVVVMKGTNESEIPSFVDMTKDKNINIRFIEYMPFDGNVWKYEKMFSFKEMKELIENHTRLKLQPCDDKPEEVAKNFRLPGHKGLISFVTSMTSAFCKDCNRVRLMADGNLKVCLFGNNEVSLRDAMREGASDDDLLAVISAAVDRKKAAHAGMFEISRSKNRAMVKIGG